jgi:phosphoribosylformylglycinamidine cyclo-ligase
MAKVAVKGLAHITGGGLTENIPRVLPADVCAHLDSSKWPRLPIFDWLQKHGHVDNAEMRRTFNCGIGMVLVVAKGDAKAALEILNEQGASAYEIGAIAKREEGGPQTVVA